MLRFKPVIKTVMTLLLSTTMALPVPSFAQNESAPRPGVTEDVPVVIAPAEFNGQPGTAFVFPVDREIEEQVVDGLARSRPEETVLMVAGQNDPALKAAARTGYLKHIKTYIFGSAEKAPVVAEEGLPTTTKGKLLAKLKAITSAAKSDTAVGLYFGFAYAGIQGGFTGYASSSVDAGLAVFAMFGLWNSFVLTKPNYWGKILDYGGRGVVGAGEKIASLLGYEMSDRDKRIFEVVGKFAVSWTVTTLQGAYVKEFAGDFDELKGWEGFKEGAWDSAKSGVQNNYNIWDAVVLKNHAEGGYFTEKRTKWYFRWQMVVGALIESAAFRGVPYIGLAMTAVTALGALYLALNPEKQVALNNATMKFTVSFRSGVAYIAKPSVRRNDMLARRLAGTMNRQRVKTCDLNLRSIYERPAIYRRASGED